MGAVEGAAAKLKRSMSSSRLGAIMLRRSKTLTLISELRGSRVSNDPSLLSSSRFVSISCRLYREPSSSSFLSRYRSSLYEFKSFSKTLFGPPKRQMTTSATIIGSAKSEITSSGLKMLVAGGPRPQKMVGIWLFGCAAWVFSMVVLGGVTRLTRSGLSMTDWKFTGGLPPFTEEEWLLEFEKYQQSPEYKRVNKGMSLGDFKFIYWMEYAHRMWGRGLGLVFALPFSYFLAKGFITRQLGLRLSALFALGGGQGLIGWWMVKSGLEEPASDYVQPRVSPYRLATHLISAFGIYCGIFWTALSVVMPEPPNGSISWVNGAAKVRKMALPLSVLVGVTAFSGAFVAGNDAGHAYNTFPKMGDSWIPDDIFSMEPLVRNFFENTSTVQLGHRILAATTLLSVGSLWLASRKIDMHPAVKSLIGSDPGYFDTSILRSSFSCLSPSSWSIDFADANASFNSHPITNVARLATVNSNPLWQQKLKKQRIQDQLKTKLVVGDDFAWILPSGFSSSPAAAEGEAEEDKSLLRYIGGVDVSFSKADRNSSSSLACAALVVLDARSLKLIYEDYTLVRIHTPYVPGFLAFREAPVLLQLLDKMKRDDHPHYPQVLMVDGNGLLHPRGGFREN
ncbi:uncharacterized protein A4U43_C05F35890 [Asparagus officinalis]|uniref:Endonuclease V n=1 Tax=Asparagus officinalis TaxID=4686 RepID=A0A5P1EX26_ASPOF|nr:uncharacterized protein A4U43_C05F35890 [Asparagus officinalis]